MSLSRLIVLNAFRISSLTKTKGSVDVSRRCLAACTAASQPPLVPYPSCVGRNFAPKLPLSGCVMTFIVSLRRVHPTAIGRTPPSPLLRAHRAAPKKNSLMGKGTSPRATCVAKRLSASNSSFPASEASLDISVFRCPGVRPSGPPEEPGGKEMIPFRISSMDIQGMCRVVSSMGGI